MGGDGGGLDPDPERLLRPVRAEAAARPGDDRPAPAPVVRARHGRTAHPQRRGQRAPLRRRSAATSTVDRYRAGDTGSFAEAAAREPGRLRIGWSTKPVTLGVRPDPVHVAAVEETARLLADLGHDVAPGRPAVPRPDAGVRAAVLRRDPQRGRQLVEHHDRLERRTRQTYRMGTWVTPRVVAWALRADREGLREGQPRLRRLRRPAHPGDRAPPAAGRDPRGQGNRRLGLGCPPRHRVRRPLERRRQPGGRRAVRHSAPTGCPRRCSSSAAPTTRPPCSAWRRRSSAPGPGLLWRVAKVVPRGCDRGARPRHGVRGAQGGRRRQLRRTPRVSSSGSLAPTARARPRPSR